jgi:hypothetical protein
MTRHKKTMISRDQKYSMFKKSVIVMILICTETSMETRPIFKVSRDPQTQGLVSVILASVDLSLNTSFSIGVYESRED